MPAADFCRTIRVNCFALSLECRDVQQISRDKFDRLPRATTEFTLCVPDRCGLAIIGPLARHSRLRSGSCTLARRTTIGIGGTVTRPPLPHHRRCGSAYGGSEGYASPSNSLHQAVKVAVGIPVTGYPPHGSVRALLSAYGSYRG